MAPGGTGLRFFPRIGGGLPRHRTLQSAEKYSGAYNGASSRLLRGVPGAMKAMLILEAMTGNLTIEQPLLHLIKIRASQLNGCAFCTDMHSIDARRLGETDRRLYSIVVWRSSGFFTPGKGGPGLDRGVDFAD